MEILLRIKRGWTGFLVFAFALSDCVQAGDWAEELDMSFGMGSENSILEAGDCGLVNGHLSLNGWVEDVAEVRSLFAPPYFCGDFRLSVLFNGTNAVATHSFWRPEVLEREGRLEGWSLKSWLYPIAGERGAILAVEAKNLAATASTLKVECALTGTPGYHRKWQFYPPETGMLRWKDGVYSRGSGPKPARIALSTTLEGCPLRPAFLADVLPQESRLFYLAIGIGDLESADALVKKAIADPEATIGRSVSGWRERVRRLASRIPRFDSDDPGLRRVYCRSLLHFLLTEWNVDEFVLRPFYATGGLFGACLCSYLWNLGGPYRMMPLVAPEALKDHLEAYLRLDLMNCYAINPSDGGPVGPYYPINQEKMIFLIRAYVLETGDVGFLRDEVGGRSVIEHVVAMALAHDALDRDAVIADYGKHNEHLELRRGYLYDGELPDMNLRRIVLLRLADKLCRIAGHDPQVDLVARAKVLKRLCRERLWDAEAGWFSGVCSDGRRTTRWTLQMFKALGWDDWVLDPDMDAALRKHLMDECEFLGRTGLHSLSKKDVAYDDGDVDNGGPGSCVSFAPAIVERLYADGHYDEGDKILGRLKWLGEALPYWGDSQYADRQDYRHDTPLQLNIEGGCPSQTILFGLFGIRVRDDFAVSIRPHLPEGADRISLENVRMAGKEFSIECRRDRGTTVEFGGRRREAPLGKEIVL